MAEKRGEIFDFIYEYVQDALTPKAKSLLKIFDFMYEYEAASTLPFHLNREKKELLEVEL